MRLWPVLVGVCLSACAHRVECPAHGGPAWRELRTQHFSMLTDLEHDQAATEVVDLEELRLAIRWYFDLPPEGEDFTQIVFLQNQEELGEFDKLGGYATTGELPELGFVVSTWSPPASWRRSQVVPHELAHRFSFEAFPLWPPWLEEGVATYLETVKLSGPWTAKVGGVSDYLGFEGAPHSITELWALPPFGSLEGQAQGRAYGSAWAYVHYLSNQRKEKWASFVKERKAGVDPRTAFETAFPLADQPAIEEQVAAYKKSANFVTSKLEFTYARRILSDDPVPDWRVHLLRRQLLKNQHAPKKTEAERLIEQQAEAALARTVSTPPLPWPVDEALAGTDAKAILNAARTHPESYLAQVTLAQAALTADDFPTAVALSEGALKLEPKGPSALRILGWAKLDQKELDAAASALTQAQRLAPWSYSVTAAMCRLESVQGRCRELASCSQRLRALDDPLSARAASWNRFDQESQAYCRRVQPSASATTAEEVGRGGLYEAAPWGPAGDPAAAEEDGPTFEEAIAWDALLGALTSALRSSSD